MGGSGYYHWSINDEKVALISGSGVVRSVNKGVTYAVVKDSLNPRNYHSIKIEVAPVMLLKWLEDHSEVKKNTE